MNSSVKKLFIGNYKGGVGKTTIVCQLSKLLAQDNYRCLLVDLDPQGSLTEILIANLGKSMTDDLVVNKSLNYAYDLYISKIQKFNSLNLNLGDSIIINLDANTDMIATTPFYTLGLDRLNEMMTDSIEYLSILKQIIESISKKYDYIIFDCPPTNNIVTKSAFLISDYYIIPTILDLISVNGIEHYIKTVKETYSKYCVDSISKYYFGNEPQLLGVFFNLIRGQVSYNKDLKDYKDKLVKLENELDMRINTFDSIINNYVDIQRDTSKGNMYFKTQDFNKLYNEIVNEISKY